jgi:hypothetical protein
LGKRVAQRAALLQEEAGEERARCIVPLRR